MERWFIGPCAAGALVVVSVASSQVVLAPTVFHTAHLPSDSITTFTVTCPPGYLAVSAGVSTAAAGVTTLSIKPGGLRAFVFRFGNPSTNPHQTVTVAVACRKLPVKKGAKSQAPFLKLVPVKTKPALVPAEGQKQVVLTCPKETLPAGAGFDAGPLELRSQTSDLSRFMFTVRNPGARARPAVFYGNCVTIVRPSGSAPGRLQVKVLTGTTPLQPGSNTIRRSCPPGWVAFGTGYTLAPKLTLGASAAIDGGGKWTIANAAGSQVPAVLQLACGRLA